MTAEVFFSSVIIKEDPEANMINGVYRPDDVHHVTKKCIIVAVGPGFWSDTTQSYQPLPFVAGDRVVVAHANWLEIDCEEGEKHWRISPDLIIKRTEED